MTDEPLGRFEFQQGKAFPAEDRMARYVMRLSMALGDLRVAVDFAVRDEQPAFERVYFVRLTAAHLRELLHIIEAKGGDDSADLPKVDEFVASLPEPYASRNGPKMRAAFEEAVSQVDAPMPDREPCEGQTRTLRHELRRLRNGFAHYHGDVRGDGILKEAMRQGACYSGTYSIRQNTMRAEFADDISNRVVHPFDVDDEQAERLTRDLHGRITTLVGPLSQYVALAEASYLHARRAAGIVKFVPPKT